MNDHFEYTWLIKGYADKVMRHEKDGFLISEEKNKLCILQREGAATAVISLLCVVYPRLPSSTCLHSDEYILYWGRDLNALLLPTAGHQQALKLSACPSFLSHPSCLFWHSPSFSISEPLFVPLIHWQRERDRETMPEGNPGYKTHQEKKFKLNTWDVE